jgi:hypothetical protein
MNGVAHIWICVSKFFDPTHATEAICCMRPGRFPTKRTPFLKSKSGTFFFQTEMQGECVLRARQLDFDWMTLAHVDQFIQVSSPGLKEHLDRVPDQGAIGGWR